eukprot:symbB.v1.2.019419.t1/scaffold1560.1/size111759/10
MRNMFRSLACLLFVGCQSDKSDLSSTVCDASGSCQEERYFFPSFNYRNGLGDQRLLWFQTALKLAHSLGRTLVLPPFWVPEKDGDQYQDENAHFEPFENLYDPKAFEQRIVTALNVPLGRYSHLRVWWRSLMMNGDTARFDASKPGR